MASNARIFFPRVGTTFLILGVGFGSGLMMANSALRDPLTLPLARLLSREPSGGILPTTAEAAPQTQPSVQPQPQQVASVGMSSAAEGPPVKEREKRAERVDTRKAEADERRRLLAERKAKRQSERARGYQPVQPTGRQQAPVLAFGSDEPHKGFGFFGN